MTAGTLDSGFMFDVFVVLPLLALAIVVALVWMWAGREIDHVDEELDWFADELERAAKAERDRRGRS